MRYVALLRAVNVGGAKLPMTELRELCGELGWRDAATYIQSGNIVFAADGPAADLERDLEAAVEARFGFARPVMVRTAEQWAELSRGSPFPERERDEASRLMLCLPKRPLATGAAEALQGRAAAAEQVREDRGALWVYYPHGAGTSKLTPAMFDKAAGSPVTARNWRTVLTLREMLGRGA